MEKMSIVPIQNKRVFYRPEGYLRFLKSHREEVKSVNIRPAVLGQKGFGSIEVETKIQHKYGKVSIAL